MIIGFDIDGVIADIDIPILRMIDFLSSEKGRKTVNHYYYSYRKVELDPAMFSNHPGDKIILVTSRPSVLKDITINWLKRNKIKYDKLIVLNHKPPTGFIGQKLNDWFIGQAKSKADALKKEGIEIYFEDTPDTVKHLRELCPNIKIVQYGLRDMKLQ